MDLWTVFNDFTNISKLCKMSYGVTHSTEYMLALYAYAKRNDETFLNAATLPSFRSNVQFYHFDHCAYDLVRFRHENPSVKVRKGSYYGLKWLL